MSLTLLSEKSIPSDERLILALDVDEPSQAIELVDRLGDAVQFYKMGLQLFMAGGYFELLDLLKSRGKRVFVDLKFFDVPNTVASAVARLAGRGADFATIHGNDSMLRAAAEVKGDLKILAVTALTSLDRGDLNDLGFQCDIAQLVLSRATRALDVGCDGVISSGLEAKTLRENLGHRLMVITPGIRPVDNRNEDDQKRVMTPGDAFRSGADYIVVGRPIRNAEDPRKAALSIQAEIREVFEHR
jgi:orotidine-5'-phosphate decarboxylase